MSAAYKKVEDLRLADVVKLFDGPWSTGVVSSVTGHDVTVFRPYGTTADFSMGEKVITYIGSEHVTYPKFGSTMLLVMERKELK